MYKNITIIDIPALGNWNCLVRMYVNKQTSKSQTTTETQVKTQVKRTKICCSRKQEEFIRQNVKICVIRGYKINELCVI